MYRYEYNDANKIVFSNPDDARQLLTVSSQRVNKKAGTLPITGLKSMVKTIGVLPVVTDPTHENSCAGLSTERFAIVTDISGSFENRVEMAKAVADHLHIMGLVYQDLVGGKKPLPSAELPVHKPATP